MLRRPITVESSVVPHGGIFSHFLYVSLTCDLRLALGRVPLQYVVSFSSVYHNMRRWLNAIGQKKTPSYSLIIIKNTHDGDREKRSGQAQLFRMWTIGAIDRTSAQHQVLRSNSLKFEPQRFAVIGRYKDAFKARKIDSLWKASFSRGLNTVDIPSVDESSLNTVCHFFLSI